MESIHVPAGAFQQRCPGRCSVHAAQRTVAAALIVFLAAAEAFTPPSARLPQRAVGALTVGGRRKGVNVAGTSVVGLKAKAIAVFGATGGVGLEAIYQALAKGYDVKALARTPSKVVVPPGSGGETKGGSPLTSTSLKVIQGDVTAYEDVAKPADAMHDNLKVMEGGVDGVVIALGGRTTEVGKTMLTEGTKNIIKAMQEVGKTSKVSIVTSIGTGESYDQAPFLFKVIMWSVLKDAFVDKNAQESLFLDPGAPGATLDYVIVRPGGLTLGPPTGQTRILAPTEQAGSIARADVASFCLSAIEQDAYLRSAVCIS